MLPNQNTFVYFYPDFDSTDQQDAQEFLGFLLDSLHEDLNLAHSSDAVAPLSRDEEALMERLPEVEGAALAWERYLGSNDSVIVDLFHGERRYSDEEIFKLNLSPTRSVSQQAEVPYLPSHIHHIQLVPGSLASNPLARSRRARCGAGGLLQRVSTGRNDGGR